MPWNYLSLVITSSINKIYMLIFMKYLTVSAIYRGTRKTCQSKSMVAYKIAD